MILEAEHSDSGASQELSRDQGERKRERERVDCVVLIYVFVLVDVCRHSELLRCR